MITPKGTSFKERWPRVAIGDFEGYSGVWWLLKKGGLYFRN